ncbi:hypothetical protein TrLO_g2883 [Triparma laevis f. longispina]|uniref:Sfi1 spindle body domain-containing protein n=1 Tax=Triparma laevis f. longispina TaxID=1714387 RepID=A0A9W7FTF6_9STRA|nr:hypothetical protein TrLO_g2883 [Triparma laevis f. longispina]
MPSRGRLLKIGTGRHARQFGAGKPMKTLAEQLHPSDSESDDGDGTLDPNIWSDCFTASQTTRASKQQLQHSEDIHAYAYNRLKPSEFSISDTESDDSLDETLPLVSDMLMRPYMINQVMTSSAAKQADLMEYMESSGTNTSLYNKSRRYLVSSSIDFKFKDHHGRRVTYASNGDDARAYNRSLGKWVLGCRNILVQHNNMDNLSRQEQIAVARGFFVRLVIRRWHAVARKYGKFRRVMTKFFTAQRFKQWRETARLITMGDLFVGSILRSFYKKGFMKLNAHRIACKALQIMQLRSGNTMKINFTAWKAYLTLEERENARCDLHAKVNLMKRVFKKWVYEVKIRMIFVKAMRRIQASQIAPGFDRWRMVSDWIAFEQKFWGTAVERAVKKSYMRWAARTWWEKCVFRRKLKKVLKGLFKSSEVGLMTWGFGKLRPIKKRPEWKPKKLGFCKCVYALTHGGHCTCSWDLHFTKRLKNFNSLAESADTLLVSQRNAGRKFEVDYDEGLAASYDSNATTVVGLSNPNFLSSSFNASTGTVGQYDLNGRRIRRKKKGPSIVGGKKLKIPT